MSISDDPTTPDSTAAADGAAGPDSTAGSGSTAAPDGAAAAESASAAAHPATPDGAPESDSNAQGASEAVPTSDAGAEGASDGAAPAADAPATDDAASHADADAARTTGAEAEAGAESGSATDSDATATTGDAGDAGDAGSADTDTSSPATPPTPKAEAGADNGTSPDSGAASDSSSASASDATAGTGDAGDAGSPDTDTGSPATPSTPKAGAKPGPRPGPVPSPAALAKRPKPTAPVGAPEAPAVVAPVIPSIPGSSDWGRVDENGIVSVRDGDDWRVVGEYPDGTHDEALQYYVRKFDELAFKVQAVEQRHQAGGASASSLRGQASQLKKDVVGAAAVGDLAALEVRLSTMIDELAEASAREAAAQREAVDAAVAERTAIVEKVEALAARDPKSVQWKQATAELNDLFAAWQTHQKTGPRLPKSTAQALWKRFRDSRSQIERARRAFFAELDEVHKAAKADKVAIVERAEALAPRGEDGIATYRALLDDWKRSGRAGRKADDALWARFKAAGDVLYGARADRNAEELAESKPRIAAREALLEEASTVADISDIKRARQVLTEIQRRWEDTGRIFPRDAERDLDARMRKIELALKEREDVDWKRNNPETKARVGDMDAQLRDAIEALEKELEAAKAAGDTKAAKEAQEALDARTAWLRAIGG